MIVITPQIFALKYIFQDKLRDMNLAFYLLPVGTLNALYASYSIKFYENTGYLKNHLAKARLVCTHFDALFTLISNMDKLLQDS